MSGVASTQRILMIEERATRVQGLARCLVGATDGDHELDLVFAAR